MRSRQPMTSWSGRISSREPDANSAWSSTSRVRSENGASADSPAIAQRGQRQHGLTFVKIRVVPPLGHRLGVVRATRRDRYLGIGGDVVKGVASRVPVALPAHDLHPRNAPLGE